MSYTVKILYTGFVTHNVKRFILEKPKGFEFVPGQATDLSINKPGWEDKKHPFTFTSKNSDLVLEFNIKGYPVSEFPEHEGVTEYLHKLVPGDEVIIDDPWGTINYNGKGTFIAGGAGITPFIAILRDLRDKGEISGNKLFFSNKEEKDIILLQEFQAMFKDNPDDLVFTLTQEKQEKYDYGRIDEGFLKTYITDFNQNFYLCGKKPMVAALREVLEKLGAKSDTVVFEK
jgi:ferredoxin-NADP reductase